MGCGGAPRQTQQALLLLSGTILHRRRDDLTWAGLLFRTLSGWEPEGTTPHTIWIYNVSFYKSRHKEIKRKSWKDWCCLLPRGQLQTLALGITKVGQIRTTVINRNEII